MGLKGTVRYLMLPNGLESCIAVTIFNTFQVKATLAFLGIEIVNSYSLLKLEKETATKNTPSATYAGATNLMSLQFFPYLGINGVILIFWIYWK